MLASINPLGERARGNRWEWTVVAFAAGAAAAAAATGALLGAAGGLLGLPSRWHLAALGLAALVAAALDVARPGRVPTVRRQVDERWLGRFRGWVYGVGFGAQLGLGVATVVTSATVYAWLAAALLSGSAGGGALVGASFALGRTLPFAVVGGTRRPEELRARLRAVVARARAGRLAAAGATLAVGAGCLLAGW